MKAEFFRIIFWVIVITFSGTNSAHTQISNISKNPQFTTFQIDLKRDQLRLFWADDKTQIFKSFDRINAWLKREQKQLVFAMNAGMFHYDLSPVGLLRIEGRELNALNTDTGFGNFFMSPNGVFFWGREGAYIVETSEFASMQSQADFATQSGPMLLRHSVIHPRFDQASTSRHIRNGVGIKQGQLYFVISNQAVSFYEFALYFRDELQCSDALYLDGAISSLYAIEMGRNDQKTQLGPIIGVVIDRAQ
ncbi:MAG: hypothetical protein E6Q34_05405 [Burkholderiaceae bacterium]|nr:MAG: hypothetical protein E6Q34_05405 [Burkholderiaceae bacterium]